MITAALATALSLGAGPSAAPVAPSTWGALRGVVATCAGPAGALLPVKLEAGEFDSGTYDGQAVVIDGDYCKRPLHIDGGGVALRANRTGTSLCLASQGFGCGRFFLLQNHATAHLASFALTGGFSPPGGWDGYGGAIWAERSTLALSDLRVAESVAWRGGGVFARWSNLTLAGVAFFHNTAGLSDGGAICADWCGLRLSGAVFERNSAASGGGAISATASVVEIEAANFTGNRGGVAAGSAVAQSGAGSVRCSGCSCAAQPRPFSGNVSALSSGSCEAAEPRLKSDEGPRHRGQAGGDYGVWRRDSLGLPSYVYQRDQIADRNESSVPASHSADARHSTEHSFQRTMPPDSHDSERPSR